MLSDFVCNPIAVFLLIIGFGLFITSSSGSWSRENPWESVFEDTSESVMDQVLQVWAQVQPYLSLINDKMELIGKVALWLYDIGDFGTGKSDEARITTVSSRQEPVKTTPAMRPFRSMKFNKFDRSKSHA